MSFVGFVVDLSLGDQSTFNAGQTVTFSVAIFSNNANFEAEQGFLCDESGLYMFSLHLLAPPAHVAVLAIVKGDEELVRVGSGEGTSDSASSTSVVVEVFAGEVVFVKCISPNQCVALSETRFTGRKLIGKISIPL